MPVYASLLFFTVTFGVAVGADLERGRSLYLESKHDEAAAELQQVVRDQGGNSAAHRLLGLALIESGKTDEAVQHINRAREIEDSPENRLALVRLLVAQKKYDEAEATLKDAKGDEFLYVRGLVHLHRNRHREAAEDLEAFLKDHPKHAYAHYYAGLAWSKAGKPDRMLTHFQQFVQMKPNSPEARKVRAVLRTGR